MGAKGSRKSLSDTALRTADSGYLTRRLVDVAQEVVIREENCGSRDGIVMSRIVSGENVLEEFVERIIGRYTIDPVVDPKTGEVIVEADSMISEDQANAIKAAGIETLKVRSVLRCLSKRGVCAHCYGADLASGHRVNIGEAVGVIAAQSIGEPGTQLTMRTFHTGGVAGSDITQGLPRVEELFEARRPKKGAIMSEHEGVVQITTDKKLSKISIISPDVPKGQEPTYDIPYGMEITVKDGEHIRVGDPMTKGFLYPQDILRLNGVDAVYDYIVREVQRVYRGEKVEVNDKHVEVITRQMTRRVTVDDAGDTGLLAGTEVNILELRNENEAIQARIDAGEETLRLATGTPLLLGITKAALMTESFLSAASFQETTKSLVEAAIAGKVDHLVGLKENVKKGKLIPAGTRLNAYRGVEIRETEEEARGTVCGEDYAAE